MALIVLSFRTLELILGMHLEKQRYLGETVAIQQSRGDVEPIIAYQT